LPLDILVIQLLSRTKAIYRSLARTKQYPATFHQKLQETEPTWKTIQFPQKLHPENKEIEDPHIKQIRAKRQIQCF
jgi:hypothetical protein